MADVRSEKKNINIRAISAHMRRVYDCYYDGEPWKPHLSSRKDAHVLVRHIVRTRLVRLYDAGLSMICRAEGQLAGKPPLSHSTVLNSMDIYDHFLVPFEQDLVREVSLIIEKTDDGIRS